MKKSGLCFIVFAFLAFQTGCEMEVEGNGIGNGNMRQTPELEEETEDSKRNG
jgi:hypothetical protein